MEETNSSTHLVVGAGAVGLGIGSALLAAGERVAFLARGQTAAALRAEGCARTGLFGAVAFPPDAFTVVDDVAALESAPAVTLVATKAHASRAVAGALAESAALRDADTPVVSFQNGLGNAEALADRLGAARVFSASILIGFRRIAPSRVDVTVIAEPIHIGSVFGVDPAPVAPLAAAIAGGGIPAEVNAHIECDLWAKALYNCALNPLGAMLGVPYGELGRNAAAREVMAAVVAEIFAVMRAGGHATHWSDAATYLDHFYTHLLPPTAGHESSMLQDLRAGRRTEIDALCGEVTRRGRRAGVATPVNDALLTLIRAIEAQPSPGGPTLLTLDLPA